MSIPNDTLLNAAQRLHGYLRQAHWDGQALIGPDVGIRFNARLGRFVKSYLNRIRWADNYAYLQAQGYWIMANWLMLDLTGKPEYGHIAESCSAYVLARQCPEGYWEYPNPEWEQRIATVEGCFAALGLIESYARTGQESFLTGALKWRRYLIEETGFQGSDNILAVNYFSNVPGGMVPNNTTLALLTFGKLAQVTSDNKYLKHCREMVAFLKQVQMPSGELPYSVRTSEGGARPHFICYQYNSFEFLDLAQYHRITGDDQVWPILEKSAQYLSHGLSAANMARYDCHHENPQVLYYTAALGAALSRATTLGLGDFRRLADRAFEQVLSQQNADGGFRFFSRRNYGVLADTRSYPRNLAMMLDHLLLETQGNR
ncbi:MAG: hypothetical protein HY782_11560 [Chloroflexi bacterium]|nr:hypothetical protein [Chloroflexota bacterium]